MEQLFVRLLSTIAMLDVAVLLLLSQFFSCADANGDVHVDDSNPAVMMLTFLLVPSLLVLLPLPAPLLLLLLLSPRLLVLVVRSRMTMLHRVIVFAAYYAPTPLI